MMPYASMVSRLVEMVARITALPTDAIPVDEPVVSVGVTSLDAIRLASELECELGAPMSPTLLWRYPSIAQLAAHLAGETVSHDTAVDGDVRREPIAIVGIGCRFPGADNHHAFFDLLCAGRNPIGPPPADRWAVDDYYSADPEAPGRAVSQLGGFLEGLDQFDAAFFRMSPREVAQLDPRQRLALEITWEALEDAGLRPRSLAGSDTGVFMATLSSNYGSLIFDRHLEIVDVYSGTGNGNSVVANRLSYFFDLRGPSVALDTACSGSLVALHLACQSLRSGESGIAIAGGVNVILKPDETVFFSKAGALAADGACRVFDRKASGIVRSEGAGVVVLKPLARAIADGDRIYAQVLATTVNQDGASNGIMAPNGAAQERLLWDAYRKAGISAGEVQLIEAHGTGTPLGDPIEVNALAAVLADGRAAGDRCALGSAKSNIGHTEAASGIGGVIKAALSIHRRLIPGNLHFDEPNPLIPFDTIPLYVQERTGPWPSPDRPLVGGVSAFGFAGTNAHVVLAEAPLREPARRAGGPYVLPLSAQHDEGLRRLAAAYRDALAGGAEPGSLTQGAATRRDHFDRRAAVCGRSAEELQRRLELLDLKSRPPAGAWTGARPRRGSPSLAWIFPGQGSHWPTMGRTLFTRYPAFRQAIEQCDEHYQALSGRSLIAELARDGQDSNIDQVDIAQPAIVAVQVALGAMWESFGLHPAVILGQSLGEIAAACHAGAISRRDAMRIAWERSRLMHRFDGTGCTAAVGLAVDALAADLSGSKVGVAGRLAPRLTLVSGPTAEVGRYLTRWKDAGTFVKALPGVRVALHGAELEAVGGELEAALADITPTSTRVPFVATATGSVVVGDALDAAYWRHSFLHPFDLVAAADEILGRGTNHFLEISPHPMLAAPLEEIGARHPAAPVCVSSMQRNSDEHAVLDEALARLYTSGFDPVWEEVHRGKGPVTDLPTYPWRRERHWFDELTGDSPNRAIAAPAGHGPDIHPLLGRPLHVANARHARIWVSNLTPDHPAMLRDHRVQGAVVVPGMAFVEMGLAVARQLDAAGEAGPVVIRSVEFLSALVPTTERVVQTVAETGPAGTVFRVLSASPGSSDWTLHARGEIVNAAGPQETSAVPPRRLLPSGSTADADGYYEMLQGMGLTYGGAFRALSAIRVGQGEALASVEVPADERAQWVCHPAMLDAFLQLVAATASSAGDTFRLPVGLDGFHLLAPLPDQVWCHVRARGERPFEDDRLLADVTVLGDDGRVYARVEGAAFDRIASGIGLIKGDVRRWLYEVDWQPHPATPLPSPRVAGEAFAASAEALAHELALAAHDLGDAFDELVLAYAVHALSRLGVGWKVGTWLGGDRAPAYGVADQHRRLWARLLEILAGAGIVDGCGVVRRPPPPGPAPDELAARVAQRYPAFEVELALVRRGGENLAGLLVGEVDPMAQLFTDGGDRLERLYRDTVWMRYYNAAVATAVATAMEAAQGRPLRVLEVGAGTGATTEYVLAALEGHDYTYVFTDLAPTLLRRAEQKFAGHDRIRYHQLDIERDPAAQGISVEDFDVVVAANVVHATADLRQTLANVRALVRPGGWAVLLEGSGRQPWLDLIVGGTAGWWKFHDDVRDGYPLLEAPEWQRVLDEAGFQGTVAVPGVGAQPPQIVAVAQRDVPAHDASAFSWLIVGSGDGFDLRLAAALGGQGAACVTRRDSRDVPELLDRSDGHWRIVYTRALAAPPWPDLTDESLGDSEAECMYGAVEVVQAALRARGEVRLWLVTRGAQAVGDGRPLELAQAPLWGIGRVAAVEHPELWGGVVDLDPDRPDDEAAAFLTEVLSGPAEDQIAHRSGRRFVPRLVRTNPAAVLGEGLRIRPDGAYLVTGGLRGIGMAVAGGLAEQGARRLVLLSRTELPPRRQWRHLAGDHHLRSEVEAVRSLEARGVEVILGAVDVADRGQLEAFLARYADDDRPPIRGVVHSAGLISDALLAHLDLETFTAVTRAKIRGSWLLHELLGDAADFMMLFSSATSLLGTFGQANYAAGNAFVDALAHHRRALGQPATAVNWGLWGSIGIIARMGPDAQVVESGLIEITPKLGLEALDRILRLDPAQIAAAPTDWQRFREIYGSGQDRPFFKVLLDEDVRSPSPSAAHDPEVDELYTLQDLDERRAGVRGYVARRISDVMRLDMHSVEDDAPLNSLGLDSIMAVTLRNALEHDLGAGVSIIELLEGATMADLVDRGCAALEAAAAGRPHVPPAGDRAIAALPRRSEPLPCSPAQEALWFVEEVNHARIPMYSVPVAASLRTRLDPVILRQALVELVTRHEPLRTSFARHDGRPHQFVHDGVEVELEFEDISGLPDAAQEQRARERSTDLASRPFDLSVAPLARFLLVQKSGSSLFVMCIHHLVFDGWSAGILVHELAERYEALTAGAARPVVPSELQFADYAAWLRDRKDERDDDVRWFTERLAGHCELLDLPIDFPRTARPSFAGSKLAFEIDTQLTAAVHALARTGGTTPFSVLAAALGTLLRLEGAQRDIVIATTPSHRPLAETAELIGYFVNTLLLPMSMANDQPFLTLLAQVRETTLGALEHATAPVDAVLAAVREQQGGAPPIQVVLTLQNSPMRLPDIVESFETVDNGTAKFELVLNVVAQGDRMEGWWEYSADLFRPETIARLADRFVRILGLVGADSGLDLGGLLVRSDSAPCPVVTDDERAAFSLPGLSA